MKKYLINFLCAFLILSSAQVLAEEYSVAPAFVRATTNAMGYNLIAKKVAATALKSALNKSAKGDYKIKFDSFSGVDLKKGKFKNLTIDGENISVNDEFFVSKMHLKTTSDFNYVDYTKDPIVFKTDFPMDFNIEITEEDLNKSLKSNSTISTISSILPFVSISTPKVTLNNNKMKIASAINLPLGKSLKFSMSAGLKVENGKIVFTNVEASKKNDFTDQLVNMMNKQDILENINLNLFEGSETNVKIEKVKIKDKTIYVDGNLIVKKA